MRVVRACQGTDAMKRGAKLFRNPASECESAGKGRRAPPAESNPLRRFAGWIFTEAARRKRRMGIIERCLIKEGRQEDWLEMPENSPSSRMEKQPNSRMCFVCGLENDVGLQAKFYSEGKGKVRVEWTAPERYQGYPGHLHGGIAAALLDEVAGRTVLGDTALRFFVTMKMELRYRKPVPTGVPLVIRGELVRDRGRFVETRGAIFLPDGSVAVEADVLVAEAPRQMAEGTDLDRIGWRVYPDE
jgi:acyl-coenzyme A thioesterase PaaI-like protein